MILYVTLGLHGKIIFKILNSIQPKFEMQT